MKYEFLEHTSEMKFVAYGKSLEEAFSNSILAFSEYVSRGKKINNKIKKEIELEGQDNRSLFHSFLDELVYLFDAEEFIVSKGKVEIFGRSLRAVLWGDKASNYKSLDHIKAATYAEMKIEKRGEGWEVVAVMDV
jgi:SHS2 domain-containing protein